MKRITDIEKEIPDRKSENWVLMPLVPYDPYEMDYAEKIQQAFLHLVSLKDTFVEPTRQNAMS